MPTGNYKTVRVGNISQTKLKKLVKNEGGMLTLSSNELKGDHPLLLHPTNAKKVLAAQKANKGVRLDVATGEMDANVNQLAGGSLFSGIWNFLKQNASPLMDIAQNVARPFVGDAVADSARSLARSITGKGLSSSSSGGPRPQFTKGSPEMKAKMAALRSMRKGKSVGGSFKLS